MIRPVRAFLCRAQDIPLAGHMAAFPVEGLGFPVLLANVDGELVATGGICPHEDVELVDGDLTGACLTCPGHGYEFDLASGRCRHDPDLRLRRFPVARVGDQIHIDIDLLGG